MKNFEDMRRYAKFGSYVAGVIDGYRETEKGQSSKDAALKLIESAFDSYGLFPES